MPPLPHWPRVLPAWKHEGDLSCDFLLQAQVFQTRFRFKSRQGIISEAGGDIEDTFEEIAQDNQLAESKGVELNADRASEPEAE